MFQHIKLAALKDAGATMITDLKGKSPLIGAAVKGSGAGMEPDPGGHFEDGWWGWTTDGPDVPALNLAASGATISGWTLCSKGCETIGADREAPIHIAPCNGAKSD